MLHFFWHTLSVPPPSLSPRRWKRRFKATLYKSPTQLIELVMALAILSNGLVMVAPRGNGESPFSLVMGVSLLLCGVAGFGGVLMRYLPLRAMFALSGLILRAFLTAMAFQSDWHNPAWASYFIGMGIMAWLFARIICFAAARWAQRSWQAPPSKALSSRK